MFPTWEDPGLKLLQPTLQCLQIFTSWRHSNFWEVTTRAVLQKIKETVLKNFTKSTGKHRSRSIFLKKKLPHRWFPVSFYKIFKEIFRVAAMNFSDALQIGEKEKQQLDFGLLSVQNFYKCLGTNSLRHWTIVLSYRNKSIDY